MKFISTLLLSCLFLSAKCQQFKLTTGYSLGLPRQELDKNIQPVHSMLTGLQYQFAGELKRLSVGMELGIGIYAHQKIDQTFQFDNNTSTVLPVDYSSNTFNANLQARFNLLSDKNLIIPYIIAKGGLYNFYSSIYIGDPEDDGGCHALEQENIMNDKTMYWSAGGGLQINPTIFSKNKHDSRLMIDINANTIQGGDISYINTKHLMDAPSTSDPDGKPLNVQFINASTQSIHEHKVAQVYTSPLKILEFRAGITFMIYDKQK
ncbi:MAG: hypothetical protein E6H08_18320 [Bacteroidetes bacterium]|nr:MAG: hypothetical protein E6H08_18320 [Bacteroidota bacterium]